jgi:hypothetical protein
MSDQLIEAPKKKRGGLIAVVAVVVIAIVAAIVFFLTRSDADESADGAGDGATSGKTVRIGVVGASDPYWEVYKDAAADEGIAVDIVDFTEYTQPNPALDAGELDLNQFQRTTRTSPRSARPRSTRSACTPRSTPPPRRSRTARPSPFPTTPATRHAASGSCRRPASSR